MLRLAFLFLVLIVYGSLYPFDAWAPARAPLLSFLLAWPARTTRADLVQNVLAYAPFGLFLALHGLGRSTARAREIVGRVTAVGLLLSVLMESLQQFEPARTASLADVAMNGLGAAAGALLALAFCAAGEGHGRHPLPLVAPLQAWRARTFRCGTLPDIGLAALALWALSQTSPLVPALDLDYIGRNLAYLGWQLRRPLHLGAGATLVMAAYLIALGLLMRTLARPRQGTHIDLARASDRNFLGLLAAVFAAKLMVYGRYLAIADVGGAVLALAALYLLRGVTARSAAICGSAALLAGFVMGELVSGYGRMLHPFIWVPLAGQMRSLTGLENILELFWPFFALAYFARWLTPPEQRARALWMGALLVLALVFRLEWMQQAVPGRYGDITQVLLAVCGWLLPWSFRSGDLRVAPSSHRNAEREPARMPAK
ncbi:MAG: teicoplanin resistance protein VanZ [Massilia sp.]|nr:teicoplanin resistance protein VanZ [Massilia sp.]